MYQAVNHSFLFIKTWIAYPWAFRCVHIQIGGDRICANQVLNNCAYLDSAYLRLTVASAEFWYLPAAQLEQNFRPDRSLYFPG